MADRLRMPVKTVAVELDGDYAGFAATMRTNASFGVKLDLSSGDTGRFVAALAGLIVGWNLTDEDGNELPAPKVDPNSILTIPDEVLSMLLERYNAKLAEAAKLPKA